MVVSQAIFLGRRPTEMELLWVGEVLLDNHPNYRQGAQSYRNGVTYNNGRDSDQVRITPLENAIDITAPTAILNELATEDIARKIKAGQRPIPVKRVDAFGIIDLFAHYYEIHPNDLLFYESIDEPGTVVAEAKGGKHQISVPRYSSHRCKDRRSIGSGQ